MKISRSPACREGLTTSGELRGGRPPGESSFLFALCEAGTITCVVQRLSDIWKSYVTA